MTGALLSFRANTIASKYPAIAMTTASGVEVYRFAGGQIGTKYDSPVGFSDSCRAVAWLDNGTSADTDIAVAQFNYPFVSVWKWNYATGFGTKYADPATPPTSTAEDVAFFGSPGGLSVDIAVSQTGPPYVSAYPWTTGVGFGTKHTNPAVLPGTGFSTSYGVSWPSANEPTNVVIGVTSTASPYLYFYIWYVTGGFSTNLPFTQTYTGGSANAVRFNGVGSSNALAVASDLSPYVSAYPYIFQHTVGTKYADPGTLPTGSANDVAWYTDTNLAVAHANSPYVTTYNWGLGFGSKQADPGTLPTGTGRSVAFTRGTEAAGGLYLAVGHDNSPYLSIYAYSQAFGAGAKVSNPATLPTGNVNSVKFSPYS
jgi:hypothetical protein